MTRAQRRHSDAKHKQAQEHKLRTPTHTATPARRQQDSTPPALPTLTTHPVTCSLRVNITNRLE